MAAPHALVVTVHGDTACDSAFMPRLLDGLDARASGYLVWS